MWRIVWLLWRLFRSRTTRWDDPNADWIEADAPAHVFNGSHHLCTVLHSHSPEWLVICLGTNDLRTAIRVQSSKVRATASFIAQNCVAIALEARAYFPNLRIVLVVPPAVVLTEGARKLGYDVTSVKISHQFPEAFEAACRYEDRIRVGCSFLDQRNI